jgi:hypothetical protein
MDVVGRRRRDAGRRRPALAGALVLLMSACQAVSFTPAPPPSEADATAFLARLAELARSRDFAALCDLGSGNCEHVLDEVGQATAPATDPVIVDTRVIAPRELQDDTWSLGGRVLQVCGTDGAGRPYQSEVLVFSTQGTLRAIEAVFWAGGRIADDGTVAPWTDPPLAGDC